MHLVNNPISILLLIMIIVFNAYLTAAMLLAFRSGLDVQPIISLTILEFVVVLVAYRLGKRHTATRLKS